jgi:hypothetical protein
MSSGYDHGTRGLTFGSDLTYLSLGSDEGKKSLQAALDS